MELGCTRKVLIYIQLIHPPTSEARICAGWCQDSLMWVGSQLLRALGCAPAASGACVCRASILQSDGVIFWMVAVL
jgi:hypothetical protein